MIVKNEEENLGRALASAAPLVDEIVVVDTGSTDGTRAIAERAGVRVVDFPWVDDFAAARNASLDAATGDFIVIMDADEILRREFTTMVKPRLRPGGRDGFLVRLRNLRSDGTVMSVSHVLRVFPRRPNIRFEGRIHESVGRSLEAGGGRMNLLGAIVFDHFGYSEEEHTRKDRHRRNLRLFAIAEKEHPDDVSMRYHLGLEYYSVSDYGEAEPHFAFVIERMPKSTLAGQAAAKLASMHWQGRRFEAARSVAERYTDAPTGGIDCQLVLGQAALEMGDFAVAEKMARALWQHPEKVGEIYVEPAQALDLLVRSLWGRGARDEAVSLAEGAAQKNPDDANLVELWIRLFSARFGLGAMEKSALTSVKSAQAVAIMVTRIMAVGDRAHALDLARRLGKNPAFNKFLGEMLMAAGHYNEAEAIFAARSDCGDWLALCRWKQGDARLFEGLMATMDMPRRRARWLAWTDSCLRLGAFELAEQLTLMAFADAKSAYAHLAWRGRGYELGERAESWAAGAK